MTYDMENFHIVAALISVYNVHVYTRVHVHLYYYSV